MPEEGFTINRQRRSLDKLILDQNSSVSETYGRRERPEFSCGGDLPKTFRATKTHHNPKNITKTTTPRRQLQRFVRQPQVSSYSTLEFGIASTGGRQRRAPNPMFCHLTSLRNSYRQSE